MWAVRYLEKATDPGLFRVAVVTEERDRPGPALLALWRERP